MTETHTPHTDLAQALLADSDRLRSVLDAALDCIVAVDGSGAVVEWNAAAEHTFGHRAEEALGRDLAELIAPPAQRAGFARRLRSGEARMLDRRMETTAFRRDGTEIPIELTITRIDVPGPPIFLGYLRDISERHRAEADLRASRLRIVAAADEARRRIERDLHDGAQQLLVGVALTLRLARAKLEQQPELSADLLDEALADLATATAELRELARGIHPAVLTEGGLQPALAGLAGRVPVPVTIECVPAERLPAASRGDHLLRRRRGADQRRALRRRLARAGGGRPRRRPAPARGARRRPRRRGPRRRQRPARDRGPRGRARRPGEPGEPARRRDDAARGAAVRVVIAEDSVLLRRGAIRLLEDAGFEVVGEAGDGEDLLRKVRAHKPDVAVIDIRMPPTHVDEGLQAARVIRSELPGVGVLMLSQYVEERYVTSLLEQGAEGVGYLLKDRVAEIDRFTDAIRQVASGGSVLDPEVVGYMLGRRAKDEPLETLTPREREVLGLMAEGKTNRAISETLFVSERAVERHVTSIFTKLELPTTDQDHRRVLAVLAYLRA